MADITQIQVSGTTYDLKDANGVHVDLTSTSVGSPNGVNADTLGGDLTKSSINSSLKNITLYKEISFSFPVGTNSTGYKDFSMALPTGATAKSATLNMTGDDWRHVIVYGVLLRRADGNVSICWHNSSGNSLTINGSIIVGYVNA